MFLFRSTSNYLPNPDSDSEDIEVDDDDDDDDGIGFSLPSRHRHRRSPSLVPVRLPCPGSMESSSDHTSSAVTCSSVPRDWSCDRCRQALLYDVTGNSFRCGCGHADPSMFIFRCSESECHVTKEFVSFDQQLLTKHLDKMARKAGGMTAADVSVGLC